MNEDEIRKAVVDPYHTQPTIFYICDHKACEHPCYKECNHTSNICHAKCPNGVYILSDDGTSLWQKTCQEFIEKSQDNAYEEIAVECEAEGYPSHGSNYELRVEALKESAYFVPLFMDN